jgi:hypothetical protein
LLFLKGGNNSKVYKVWSVINNMSLFTLLQRLKKPKLDSPKPIKGTSLVEGYVRDGITIWDSMRRRILFGGANPDLEYIGRVNGKHVARKQEKVDGAWKTFFVDEDGNLVFGRKYDSENLALFDPSYEETINIVPDYIQEPRPREILGGKECVLLEYNGKVLNIYDESGELLANGIPCVRNEREKTSLFREHEIPCMASRLNFVDIDGKRFVEVGYAEESEVYELKKQ